MIWTPAQVRAMEGYTFSQAVDMFLIERVQPADGQQNPVIAATMDHLFRGLQEAGHTHGLEIHKDDLRIETHPDEAGHYMVRVQAQWRPCTTGGLLIGGPAGGTHYTFDKHMHRRGVHVQVIDHRAAREMWADQNAAAGEILAPVRGDVFYEWAGWSEQQRKWVYRAVATSGA